MDPNYIILSVKKNNEKTQMHELVSVFYWTDKHIQIVTVVGK